MKCMSKELYSILPQRLRPQIQQRDCDALEEIRLRWNSPVVLKIKGAYQTLDLPVTQEDLSFVIHTASRYSPWNAESMAFGYLTAPGGHRIGVCGQVVTEGGRIKGIRTVSSLCIRVCREIENAGNQVDLRDSLLIVGPPGSGKTTLLRALVTRISREKRGAVCVVDERGELFPTSGGAFSFDPGAHTDVLSGCSKAEGVEMALRSMGPDWIAVDEITAGRDCDGLLQAAWCGVKLLATAHASGMEDLMRRQIYKPLLETKLFRTVVVLQKDKTLHQERVVL